ncbi:MAG: zinc-ribbon domain-containing protein [Bacteroidales bacterium]
MSYCKNCGAEISAGSHFCGSCGAKVTSVETKKKISAEAPAGKKVKSEKKGCKKGCLTPLFILFIAGLSILYYYYHEDQEKVGGTGITTSPEEVEEPRELTGTDIPGIVPIGDAAENNDPGEKVRSAESGDVRKASDLVEKAFSRADTVLLKQLLMPASLDRYKGVFREISPYMNEYARAFKNRKLVMSGPIYTLYEFSNDSGRKFTAEFTLDNDGNWKLVRF